MNRTELVQGIHKIAIGGWVTRSARDECLEAAIMLYDEGTPPEVVLEAITWAFNAGQYEVESERRLG